MVVVVVVEWFYHSKRIIIVRWADLSVFFRRISSENVKFCFTSKENCHFSSEKRLLPSNRLLIFFGKETHSETKPWKSSRILRLNPIFFIFLPSSIIFLHFFVFFHFFIFSCFSFFHFFNFFIFFSFFICSHFFSFFCLPTLSK